jgi:hypothetical protein
MNETEDLVKAFASVSEHFPDLGVGEAALEVLETWDGLQVVVAVGRDKGAGEDPKGEACPGRSVQGGGHRGR